MNRRQRAQAMLEFTIDLFCLVAANIISYVLFHRVLNRILTYGFHEWIRYDGILFFAFVFSYSTFYSRINIQKRNRAAEFGSIIKNAMLTFALFSVFLLMFKSAIIESRYMLVSNFVLFIAISSVGRYFLKRYLTGYYQSGRNAALAGVITTSDRAEEFIGQLKLDWSLRVKGIVLLDEYCDSDNVFRYTEKKNALFGDTYNTTSTINYPRHIDDIPVMSVGSDFMDWIRSSPLDDVFINLPYTDDSEIQEIVEELEDMGITVHINIPTLDDILSDSKFNNITCKMQYGYPMASFAASVPSPTKLFIKRAFDVVCGIFGCIVSAPVIAITAIPLKKESEGPLFFKQQRVGKNGRLFNIYKLRSMYVDAEERKQELLEQNKMDGLMFKMDDDPRITKVGKFIRKTSIDELPQFINVVKGDMSLVGTRPPTVDEFEQYESRHKRRLSMRPGITGMWQVSGRSDIQDFEEVVELDCKYIDEWSIWLDIKILFKTVFVVLTHKGAE